MNEVKSLTEQQRLVALRSYNILDTPPESGYEDIVRLARAITDKPIALVSFVDDLRQWFKAESGLGFRETPISMSVCAHAMVRPGIFEVTDLSLDPRFMNNPLVSKENGIRFYAGAPLISPEGFPLGSLCVIDTKPGKLDQEQRTLLMALGRQVMTHLELRRTITAAAAANRYRSRLMAVAGHDLKQPLQVISMILGSLQIKAKDVAERNRLDIADAALRDMSSGLDRLAADSKMGKEDELPKIQDFPIQQVLDTIEATWREHASHKGIKIRVVDSSLVVHSDPTLLTTVVANLVGNAIKYTPSGGVLVGVRRLKTIACLHVMDTGIGVPQERQAALFDAFHQEDPGSEGLGLGLSIVQRTAEALGVRVALRSRVGKGTNFSIAVPRSGSRLRDSFTAP